jgi:hypothetical protein
MLAPSAGTRPNILVRLMARTPLAGLLSFRYMMLRAWTAGGGLIAGLVQTFVFARVLDPERFSLFILVGALGVSMWLFDLGLSKILFVRMRKLFLAGEDTRPVAEQANAIAIFYASLIGAAAVLCALLMSLRPGMSLWHAAELGLFFFFSAFNLTWFVLRNVSVAIDEYVFFEALESCRRIAYIAVMLAMLAGLPFTAFIVLINLSWVVLLIIAGRRLVAKGALTPHIAGSLQRLRSFFRDNGAAALRTGVHAAGEVYIHGVLYLAVPFAFGLGAPTIVVDTALKIFLGTLNLCSAACDLLVPRQTAAHSARDRRMLIRTMLTAMALCAVPAIAVGTLLMIDAQGLFRLLLGKAATMPASVTPILLTLLLAGVLKSAPNFLLQYTGYFKEIARLSVTNVSLMTLAVGGGIWLQDSVVGLLALYAGVFVIVGVLYLTQAALGPIRDARSAGDIRA